jgi:hypothetical protein
LTLVGSATLTCEESGWSHEVPTCSCSIVIPDHGSVSSESVEMEQDVVYSCDQGYTLTGSNTTTCKDDGSLSNAAPTYEAVMRDELTAPDNGAVNVDDVERGYTASAMFTCDEGFYLCYIPAAYTCNAEGAWESSLDGTAYSENPTCDATDCKEQCTNDNDCRDRVLSTGAICLNNCQGATIGGDAECVGFRLIYTDICSGTHIHQYKHPSIHPCIHTSIHTYLPTYKHTIHIYIHILRTYITYIFYIHVLHTLYYTYITNISYITYITYNTYIKAV